MAANTDAGAYGSDDEQTDADIEPTEFGLLMNILGRHELQDLEDWIRDASDPTQLYRMNRDTQTTPLIAAVTRGEPQLLGRVFRSLDAFHTSNPNAWRNYMNSRDKYGFSALDYMLLGLQYDFLALFILHAHEDAGVLSFETGSTAALLTNARLAMPILAQMLDGARNVAAGR